jgi:hypothetical protein
LRGIKRWNKSLCLLKVSKKWGWVVLCYG